MYILICCGLLYEYPEYFKKQPMNGRLCQYTGFSTTSYVKNGLRCYSPLTYNSDRGEPNIHDTQRKKKDIYNQKEVGYHLNINGMLMKHSWGISPNSIHQQGWAFGNLSVQVVKFWVFWADFFRQLETPQRMCHQRGQNWIITHNLLFFLERKQKWAGKRALHPNEWCV